MSRLLANHSASWDPPELWSGLSIESFVYDEVVFLRYWILSRNLHMASSCQKLEVYVKAATGDPTKLGDCNCTILYIPTPRPGLYQHWFANVFKTWDSFSTLQVCYCNCCIPRFYMGRVLNPCAGPFSQRVLMTCELKDIVYDVKYVDLDKKPDWFVFFPG